MDSNFADLLEIMHKECDIYEELCNIEKEKKQVIIDNDVKALEAITAKEQGFVKAIVNLESLRAEVIDGFCKLRGISNIGTIEDLKKHVNSEQAALIEIEKQRLTSIIGELIEVNNLNTSLLEDSIDYINYTMDMLTSTEEDDLTYDRGLAEKRTGGKNLFDAKI